MIPIIRPVRLTDFDDIYALAQRSGGGMTNLPPDEDALRARVEFAVESFNAKASEPGPEVYMMVLERDGRVEGTAAVFSSIGLDSGFVNYKVNWTFHASEQLNKRIKRRLLVPTHDFTGSAEVGSLFLSPEARGGGFGKFLARTRYMFIAQSPNIVGDRICAELRGWRAPDGRQPFWEALGRNFFDMEFEEADVHNAANGNQFIADLMPRISIYVCLLPEAARECIGKPHDSAIPAYQMLLREGFEYNDYVDIFDAGPLVDTKTSNIRTIRESHLVTVAAVKEPVDPADAIIVNGAVDTFRAAHAGIEVRGDAATISAETAEALQVEKGSTIRWVAW